MLQFKAVNFLIAYLTYSFDCDAYACDFEHVTHELGLCWYKLLLLLTLQGKNDGW